MYDQRTTRISCIGGLDKNKTESLMNQEQKKNNYSFQEKMFYSNSKSVKLNLNKFFI